MNRRGLCGLFLGMLSVAALGGCGQKGPLILPEEKAEELKKKHKQKSSRLPDSAPVRTV